MSNSRINEETEDEAAQKAEAAARPGSGNCSVPAPGTPRSIELGWAVSIGEFRRLTQCFADDTVLVCRRPGPGGYSPILFLAVGECMAQVEIA